jgi:segregation and condensation protein A
VTEAEAAARPGFTVHLDGFEGPFDLLLTLIAKHRLDITELALSRVTDEFIAYIRALGQDWDLDQASEFLVVAATLLDLKAARLLPSGEPEDEEDLARLEARDLLFARLLQYRAFREVAALLGQRLAGEGRRFPRAVPLEPAYAALLPEVLIQLGPEQFAALAARALAPRPVPVVATDHLHAPRVSVRAQAALLAQRLRRLGAATFRTLRADATSVAEVVARFLALLELYREGAVSFDQVSALGELHVRWVGGERSTAETEVWAGDSYEGGESRESAGPAAAATPAGAGLAGPEVS